ncbi:MAG: DUF2029 domain-containing protein [Acidobacteriota bacterium]|nr:DUF2029 domain-containing protein [Acidobacteriota bacterium]
MTRLWLRRLSAGLIVVLGYLFVCMVFYSSLRNQNPAHRDFIEYWASERLLLKHQNPYNPSAIHKIEVGAGLDRPAPEISFSPPVFAIALLPLGMVNAQSGLILWSIALFTCLSISIWLLWRLCERRDPLLILLGFAFGPVIACISASQIGIFLLLSLMLFFELRETWPFLAGVALTPLALKPHLFLPFMCVLLLWQITRRSFRILGGFAVGLLANCGLAAWYAPQIWTQYRELIESAGILDHFVPTLSVVLRHLIAPNQQWLQFAPVACACVWSIWYFLEHRARWSWTSHGMLVLLVSSLCPPYAWFTDESVLLPAVMLGLIAALTTNRPV